MCIVVHCRRFQNLSFTSYRIFACVVIEWSAVLLYKYSNFKYIHSVQFRKQFKFYHINIIWLFVGFYFNFCALLCSSILFGFFFHLYLSLSLSHAHTYSSPFSFCTICILYVTNTTDTLTRVK